MNYIDTGFYITATPFAIVSHFSNGLVSIAAFLAVVALWILWASIASLCEYH